MLDAAERGEHTLLISPTGGGKTLAGFLPSFIDISGRHDRDGIHTLYISPLKALAVDIARNLEAPIREMALPVTHETRTGDTPHSRRKRQREKPPDILITTPEQVSLLVADPHAGHLLRGLKTIIIDELHSLVTSKRGVLLSLALAAVAGYAPTARRIGLSATVGLACTHGRGPCPHHHRKCRCCPQHPHSQVSRAGAVVRPFGPLCHAGCL
jgi:ATP-dependent Lhr-like helicase